MFLNFKENILISVTSSSVSDDSLSSVLVPDDFVYFDKIEVKNELGIQTNDLYHDYKTVVKNLKEDYISLRKLEYDSLNQLELFYDDQANGTTFWMESIEAIKKKYPKSKK